MKWLSWTLILGGTIWNVEPIGFIVSFKHKVGHLLQRQPIEHVYPCNFPTFITHIQVNNSISN